MELATVFKKRKDVFCCLQETPRKTEKDSWLFWDLLQGSNNFKTSGLSDYDKNKVQVQAINEGKYIKSTKRGEHYHPTL